MSFKVNTPGGATDYDVQLSQTLPALTSGSTYTLSFASKFLDAATGSKVTALIDGTSIVVHTADTAEGNFVTTTATFVANGQAQILAFQFLSPTMTQQTNLDTVSIALA